MRRIGCLVASIAMISLPAAAGDPSQAVALVHSAIAKGHGVACSLEMLPVATGGYYPCVDVGPYRVILEYGRTRAFVIIPGQAPFEILVSDAAGTRFQSQGVWEADFDQRVSDWWNEVVMGGQASNIARQAEADRAAAAGGAVETYLKSLTPSAASSEPTEVPGQPVPQVIYIVPPGYLPAPNGQQAAPALAPSPPAEGFMPAPGGVLVAPGVVAYPDGAPA